MTTIEINGTLGPKHAAPEDKVDAFGVPSEQAELYYKGFDRGHRNGRTSTRYAIFSMGLFEFWLARRSFWKWEKKHG